MTESEIMAEIAKKSGTNSPAYRAMQAKKDARNARRRGRYAEDKRQVDRFMAFLHTI
jgi:negative regulator of replication initiation